MLSIYNTTQDLKRKKCFIKILGWLMFAMTVSKAQIHAINFLCAISHDLPLWNDCLPSVISLSIKSLSLSSKPICLSDFTKKHYEFTYEGCNGLNSVFFKIPDKKWIYACEVHCNQDIEVISCAVKQSLKRLFTA